MDLTLFEETTAETDIQEEATENTGTETAEKKTSASDRFYNAVKEMKNRQHNADRELVALMAKKLCISDRDYDGMKARLTEEKAEEKPSDDISDKLKGWKEREREVQQLYPGFDLTEELKNRDFFNLCYNGVDVMTAYQVLHLDDIIMSAMSYAVAELKRAGALSGRAERAREGALESGGRTKQEKPKLTKKERNELIRRAERGETVRL